MYAKLQIIRNRRASKIVKHCTEHLPTTAKKDFKYTYSSILSRREVFYCPEPKLLSLLNQSYFLS